MSDVIDSVENNFARRILAYIVVDVNNKIYNCVDKIEDK